MPRRCAGWSGAGRGGRMERRRVSVRPRMEVFRKEGNGGAGGGQEQVHEKDGARQGCVCIERRGV